MTFEERLDALLRFIRIESKGVLRPRFTIDELYKYAKDSEIGVDLGGDEDYLDTLDILFDQLLADGLVRDMEMPNEKYPSYKITAKGVLTDGYVAIAKQKKLEAHIRARNENLLSRGTIALSIFTGGLLLIEALKFLIDYIL